MSDENILVCLHVMLCYWYSCLGDVASVCAWTVAVIRYQNCVHAHVKSLNILNFGFSCKSFPIFHGAYCLCFCSVFIPNMTQKPS